MINIGARKLCFNEKLEPYFEETVDKQGTIKNLTMADAGFCKKIEFDIVIKREFVNNNGEPKILYFLQHCKAQIPNERAYKYVYISKFPSMLNVAISYFDPTSLDSFGTHSVITTLLDFSDGQFISKVGTAKKMTPEQIRKLVKEKAVLGIFKDDLRSQLAI
jgi:hypothetical protein